MKKINEEQLNAIINLLTKYNIGVNDFVAVQNLFKNLSDVEPKTEPKDKDAIPLKENPKK